jgi:ubiquinone/menaquinone biosynthesis C-methylase UbiE
MKVWNTGELERIRTEYQRRDAAGLSEKYSYTNPPFQFHMQEREWAVLLALRQEGFEMRGTKVIEVGCGTGHILRRFLDFGAGQAVGIDLMETRVHAGKARYAGPLFVQGNAAGLPFRAATFGLATQFMCLSSVLDSSVRRDCADEMWRVLKPGGMILFYDLRPTPLLGRCLLRPLMLFRRLLELGSPQRDRASSSKEPETPIRPLSLHEIRQLFPLGRVEFRTVSLHFELAELSRLAYWLAYALSLLSCLRTHYLVTIRKANVEGG